MSAVDGSVGFVPTGRATEHDVYRYEWALFIDWCTAADIAPLPTSSVVLAEFLGENPASDAAQRRRVAAIDRRHRDAGLPPPGSVTSIRVALDRVRADRVVRRATHDRSLAAALPRVGAPAALFGRRDAVLLLLAGAGAGAGLSYTAIAALDRAEVTADGHDLWVGGSHRVRIAASGFPPGCLPAQLWERWQTVMRFSDRHPSTTTLLKQLRENTFPDMNALPDGPGPVAVPIDRWGHMPFPMTPATIADVVEAHRTGTAPPHTTAHGRCPSVTESFESDDVPTWVAADNDPVMLDPGYYRCGFDARKRAHTLLSDVSELTDDIDNRIEQLLQRTLELLDDTTPPPDAG